MKVKLIHKSGYHSKIENQNGNSMEIDNKSDLSPKGVSPMELLLMGVAGCSSIDIISILKNDYKIGFLSRGYGRNSSGYILANERSDVIEIGDEPYLIKRNHKGVAVAVAEKRVIGIKNTMERVNNIQMFVLDDAFQHRNLKCSLNIVLSKFSNPYYNDFVLPTGNLREPKSKLCFTSLFVFAGLPSRMFVDLSKLYVALFPL